MHNHYELNSTTELSMQAKHAPAALLIIESHAFVHPTTKNEKNRSTIIIPRKFHYKKKKKKQPPASYI